MKTEKYCLILIVITGILYVPALGQIEPTLPEYEDDSLLIGRANPALAGIDNLVVTIIHPDEEPNGLVWEKLKAQINNKLNEAGITVFTPEPGVMYKLPILPELIIRVDMLKLEQSQQYVFHIQTSLAKNIHIQIKPALRQKADVWKTEPVMQAVSAQDMPAAVTNIVLEQSDTFITAYIDANPKGTRPADPNQTGISQKESAMPPDTTATTKDTYVASKKSQVFHKSTCSSAKRISPENLVHYKTREDAINDGKRPCKSCNP
jgi:hypothetical protein